jgi:hypothetical protein
MGKTPVRYCAARLEAKACAEKLKRYLNSSKTQMIYYARGKKLSRSKQLKISKNNTALFKGVRCNQKASKRDHFC